MLQSAPFSVKDLVEWLRDLNHELDTKFERRLRQEIRVALGWGEPTAEELRLQQPFVPFEF